MPKSVEEGMKQGQTLSQELRQTQQQSPQQILVAQMTELPMMGLEQRIEEELIANPALERVDDGGGDDYAENDTDAGEERMAVSEQGDGSNGESTEGDDMTDYIDRTYEEEELVPVKRQPASGLKATEMAEGDGETVLQQLRSQISVLGVSEREKEVLGVLVLFLDRKGLLRESERVIREEMEVYHALKVGEGELEHAIKTLQTLEPKGIGARTLRECFLLQVRDGAYESPYKGKERDVLERCFDDFMGRRVASMARKLRLSEKEAEAVYKDMCKRLNPSPLGAMEGSDVTEARQVVADFVVRERADGSFSVRLSNSRMPELTVSREFKEIVERHGRGKPAGGKKEQEAYMYAKDKVDRAQGFIAALKQRQETLLATMTAIVEMQEDFFRTGDEALLHPMVLQDVAERVGVDRSTISRVNNSKYVDTVYGMFGLKFFFHEGFKGGDGEEVSKSRILSVLRELVDKEDKKAPLSDDELTEELHKRGFDVARRTVAKYRDKLGIAVARLRR